MNGLDITDIRGSPLGCTYYDRNYFNSLILKLKKSRSSKSAIMMSSVSSKLRLKYDKKLSIQLVVDIELFILA